MSAEAFDVTRSAAILIPKLEPSEGGVLVGGHVNILKSVCRGIAARRGGRMDVFTCSTPDGVRALDAKPVPWARVRAFPTTARRNSTLFGLAFCLRMILEAAKGTFSRYRMIYGHSGWAVYAWVTYIVASLSRRQAIHAIYCPFPDTPPRSLVRRLLFSPAAARPALNRMRWVIATSENIARSLARAGVDQDKIVLVLPAVDEEKFHPRNDGAVFRTNHRLPLDAPIILYVGNLMPSKGLDILLEAMPTVLATVPKAHLVVTLELGHAGFDEAKKGATDWLAARGIEDRVTFLGFVDDMPGCMAAANVFVSPYRDTQGPSDYPVAAMEAMASGKPVVGTAVGGIPELVRDRHNGRLVPPEDASQLGAALAEILSDSELCKRFGAASRQLVEDRFSLARAFEAHRELLAI